MKDKIIPASKVKELVYDGMTIMIGGFLGNGNPEKLIDMVVEAGIKDINLIANDTSIYNDKDPENPVAIGIAKLIAAKRVKNLTASHVGTNRLTGQQMATGEMNVNLVPQGTLAERIRAGGFGLGGILTPTGIGTDVAVGKQVINVEGKDYLLETPLTGDICLIHGNIVDKAGNVYYDGTTKNFSPMVASACKTVIVEAEKLVEVGELDANMVMTPGIFVDYIVVGGAE